MGPRLWWMLAVIGAASLVAAGCVKTSRVEDGLSAAKLSGQHKAVAVMRLGSSNPNCLHVAVLLGVREGEGEGFKRAQAVTVANVRGLTEAPVAEVELDPGEYHIVAYSCVAEKGPTVVDDKLPGQLYRTSFAHFAVAAGEIVNVGFVHLDAAKRGRSAFGHAIAPELTVSDWSLEDIERFKKTRQQIAAQLTTRLMIVGKGPVSPGQRDDTCSRWRKAKADGLAQSVPPGCEASGAAVPSKSAG